MLKFNYRSLCFWGLILTLLWAEKVKANPPIITTNLPTLLLVASNSTVTFTISATQTNVSAPAVMSFQWRRNGVNIPGTLVSFTNNAVTTSYQITNIAPADGGAYSVVVFNVHGAASSTATDLVVTNTPVSQGSDNFAGRYSFALTDESTRRFNNSTASAESGEPKHGNVTASRSLWFTWSLAQMPAGVWTVDTIGSTIDTTLSVYSDPGSSTTNVSALASSGLLSFENDDANILNDYHNSEVTFTAAAGRNYAIAVDGFYGAKGYVVLNFRYQSSGSVVGIITQPHTQTVASNSTVILSATLDKAFTTYQWFRNGVAFTGTNGNPNDSTNIFLTNFNFSASSVGQYQAKIVLGGNTILTEPASLQMNSEDGGYNPNAIALPKFRLSTDSSYTPLIHPHVVAVSGFTGTHIWNTFGAAAEPGEPNHCGKVGGAPYWFAYLANAAGTLTVDANTSSYTNVLAVYTWSGGDFSQLNSVACVSTNLGVGHQVTAFSAVNGTTYYLIVDGLNGATGNCALTYNLVAAPAFTLQPQSQTVALGSNVTLTANASGIPAPTYQWRTNFVKYSNQTNTSMTVTNFQLGKEGSYDIVASNSVGMATSTVAKLYLNTPLRFTNVTLTSTGSFYAALLGKATTNYIIQANTNLATTNWVSILTNNSPYGIISFVDTNYQSYSNRFFRAK